ncbi:AraC family transcriptional regulator [Herbaspirillum lusitanum]|uniref:AraC family transcriptional regulator n=1 Tax=Herbaspirillum lusitanum TaxID=213312 RepID=A0ABW9A3Z2_9BURK
MNLVQEFKQAPVIDIPAEDAFSVIVQLQDFRQHKLWRGNKLMHAGGHARGEIAITHLGDEWRCQHLSTYDNLRFHIPRKTINDFSYEDGRPAISHFDNVQGAADTVAFHLAQAVLPMLGAPSAANSLFIDSVALALYTHLANRYGQAVAAASRRIGRLAGWQEQRAKAFMAAHLTQRLSLASIAAECGLSRSHFARQFKHSTGMPVHMWLQNLRIERARHMLLHTDKTVTQIALECGFADQSHFSRVFRNMLGTTPVAWLRLQRLAAA